jgi:excisionase family DNA binding protein
MFPIITTQYEHKSFGGFLNNSWNTLFDDDSKIVKLQPVCIKFSDGSGSLITGNNYAFIADLTEEYKFLFSSKIQYTISNTPTITGTKEQIEDLRWSMGLNISEIASLLRVKRPTVYEWLKEKTLRPRKQKRLAKIHNLCKKWKAFAIGRLDNYLYKTLDGNKNLFSLLNEENLREDLIDKVLHKIKDDLMCAQNKKTQRDATLKQAGFHHISGANRGEIKLWLDRKIRRIG